MGRFTIFLVGHPTKTHTVVTVYRALYEEKKYLACFERMYRRVDWNIDTKRFEMEIKS